jgi:hypothetical protein
MTYKKKICLEKSMITSTSNQQMKNLMLLMKKAKARKEKNVPIVPIVSSLKLAKIAEKLGAAAIVVEGGNTDMPYSVLFSFAGQDYGAPFIGYFANVRYNDGIDDMIIPATGIISNAYMRKFNEAGKHAWDIVACDLWPIAGEGVTDVDWVVSQGQGSDLDSLEPAGWNMLQRDDVGNITILAERTAQNSFLSAFSYLSTLDLSIYHNS